MSDEMSAIIKAELDGTVYLIKGSYFLLSKILPALAGVVKWTAKGLGGAINENFRFPGGTSFSALQKASEGDCPQFEVPIETTKERYVFKDPMGNDLPPRTYNELTKSEKIIADKAREMAENEYLLNGKENFRKDVSKGNMSKTYEVDGVTCTIKASEFGEAMKQNKVVFATLPDPNPSDNFYPVAVRNQDAAVMAMWAKRATERDSQRLEIGKELYLSKANEEKIAAAKCTEGQEELYVLHLQNAKFYEDVAAQYDATINENLGRLSNDCKTSLEEQYVNNPEFQKDPDYAMELSAKGILAKEVSTKEAFLPIRIIEKVPEGNHMVYADSLDGNRIERDFIIEDNKFPYSIYSVTDKDGKQIASYSDEGLNNVDWINGQFPNMMRDAGFNPDGLIIEGISIEAIEAKLNLPAPEETSEKNVSNNKVIDNILSEAKKEEAKSENFSTTSISVGVDKILKNDKAVVHVKLPDDESFIEFPKAAASLSKDQRAGETLLLKFDKDASYKMYKSDGSFKEIKGMEVGEMLKAKGGETRAPQISMPVHSARK